MKKIRILTLILCAICCTTCLKIHAEDGTTEIVEETKNLEEMFEFAKSNQTLLVDENIIPHSFVSDELNEFSTEIYEYTPNSYDYGDIHSRTYVAAARTTGLSKTSEGYDSSYSYYGYLKVTYNDTTSNGNKQYLLTSVRGSWQQKDLSVSISNRKVTYACNYRADTSQYRQVSLSSNSFSKSTGFSKYAIDDGVSTAVGAYTTATLTHGSSYTFEISAYVCLRSTPAWW